MSNHCEGCDGVVPEWGEKNGQPSVTGSHKCTGCAHEAELAERRQQVEALQQLLDEITVASGAGIVCRPIDLPVFISNMKVAVAVADEMAAWDCHGPVCKDVLPAQKSNCCAWGLLVARFHAAREKVKRCSPLTS